MQDPDNDPMRPGWRESLYQANVAPRCQTHSERTGLPCQGPAVRGWIVCRMHGAGGGHAAGTSHPSWKRGARSQEAVEVRNAVNKLVREAGKLDAPLRQN